MMRKLLPIILALLGLGVGIGAGVLLRPAPGTTAEATAHGENAAPAEGESGNEGHDSGGAEEAGPEYVKLNNQFVVPVVEKGRVVSMVVLSLSLEVEAGSREAVYEREPKLRDEFLQVMFDHANMGGFSGSFTDGANMILLRNTLTEAAVAVMGKVVRSVLITDIARQDS